MRYGLETVFSPMALEQSDVMSSPDPFPSFGTVSENNDVVGHSLCEESLASSRGEEPVFVSFQVFSVRGMEEHQPVGFDGWNLLGYDLISQKNGTFHLKWKSPANTMTSGCFRHRLSHLFRDAEFG
jgi:hypothetical protein